MEGIRVHRVTLDIRDPTLFCADKIGNAENEIANKYIGRCYKGEFLVKLLKITMIGDCRISSSDISCNGIVDVEFIAQTIHFMPGSIIPDMRITTTQESVVGTSLSMPVHGVIQNVDFVSVDDVIPVRVSIAKHTPMVPRVIVVASLTQRQQESFFHAGTALRPPHAPALADLYWNIIAELVRRNAMIENPEQKEKIAFFESLLYPFTGGIKESGGEWTSIKIPITNRIPAGAVLAGIPVSDIGDSIEWKGPKVDRKAIRRYKPGGNEMNIMEMVTKIMNGDTILMPDIIYRPLSVVESSPIIYQVENALDGHTIQQERPVVIAGIMLRSIYETLVGVRRLVETYSNDKSENADSAVDKIKKNKRVWEKMRSTQSNVS